MSLPYVIEYLLSLERPGGGHLVVAGASQIIIPIFPPNTTITLTAAPWGDDYMYIPYLGSLGPAVIPNVFYAWASHWGNKQYEGTIASWFVNNPIDAFVYVSKAEPAMLQIQNLTPLNQYYEGLSIFLRIQSVDDYHLVQEALRRLGTSARSEELASDANALLNRLAGGGA